MKFKEIKLEFNAFCKMFNYFTVSMRVINELNDEISIFDVLNHYRIKTLKNEDMEKIKKVKLYNFKSFKGLNTDLVFITFKIRPMDLKRIESVFNPIDRSYRKYKIEFTKSERQLLFKLKNNNAYKYNHRDCISNAMQMDLSGNVRELPFEETYKNPIQTFESEYDFKSRKKREKWIEIKRKRAIKSEAIKALRLWIKLEMPRLPRYKKEIQPDRAVMWRKLTPQDRKNWLAGYNYQKTMKFDFFGSFIGTELKQNLKVKKPPTVVVVKPEDNHWFEKKEKHLW